MWLCSDHDIINISDIYFGFYYFLVEYFFNVEYILFWECEAKRNLRYQLYQLKTNLQENERKIKIKKKDQRKKKFSVVLN